jgi:hypothetical protein
MSAVETMTECLKSLVIVSKEEQLANLWLDDVSDIDLKHLIMEDCEEFEREMKAYLGM